MSRLRARVAKLDGDQAVTRWEIWHVDGGVWTNEREHPGEVFTEAEVDALPVPPGVGRIVVHFVDMSPADFEAEPEGDA